MFIHDSTTFGGASGASLLFVWHKGDTPSFALQVPGTNAKTNYAMSLHKAAKAIEALDLRMT